MTESHDITISRDRTTKTLWVEFDRNGELGDLILDAVRSLPESTREYRGRPRPHWRIHPDFTDELAVALAPFSVEWKDNAHVAPPLEPEIRVRLEGRKYLGVYFPKGQARFWEIKEAVAGTGTAAFRRTPVPRWLIPRTDAMQLKAALEPYRVEWQPGLEEQLEFLSQTPRPAPRARRCAIVNVEAREGETTIEAMERVADELAPPEPKYSFAPPEGHLAISILMRAGARLRPHVRLRPYAPLCEQDPRDFSGPFGSSALGAVYEAALGRPFTQCPHELEIKRVVNQWRAEYRRDVGQDACERCTAAGRKFQDVTLRALIVHLEISHGYSRELIAEYIASKFGV